VSSLGELRSVLLDQRVVLVSGELDAARSSELAATLMTLDAIGDGHVELRLQSCHGPIAVSLAVLDVLDVLGVPVRATALGTIEGGPVGVFASCERRRIARNATLCLREPDVEVAGTAGDLERALAAQATQRAAFLEAIARRVGRAFAEVEAEWGRSARLEAIDAVTLGYADGVLDRAVRRSSDDA